MNNKVWVDATERGYLVFPDPFIMTLEVVGDNDINLDQLKQAVVKASISNPTARSVIRGYLGFSHWVDSHHNAPVFDVPDWNYDNAYDLWRKHDIRQGPNVMVLRIPKGFVIQIHHALFDGMGIIMFTEDIFRCLRGEPALGENAQYSNQRLFFDRSLQCPAPEIIKNDAKRPFTATHHETRSVYKRFKVAGRFGQPVSKVAYAIGKAIEGHCRLKLLVDLRHYQPKEERTLRNMTGLVFVDIDQNESPNEIQEKIKIKLNQKLDLTCDKWFYRIGPWIPIRMMRGLLNLFINKANENPFGRTSGTLSSIGRLPKGFYCDHFIAKSLIPIPYNDPTVPFFCCMSYTRTHIDFMIKMSAKLGSDGRIDLFAENIKQALQTL